MSLSTKTVCVGVTWICATAGSIFAQERKLYWTNSSAGTIQRANLDGSNVEDVITGLSEPYALVADLPAERLYWSERTTGKIRFGGLDGSGARDLVSGTGGVVDLVVDSANGFLYWTELSGPVQRVKPDGSALETLPLPAIYPEALLLEGSKLYIGSNLAPSISVCDLFNLDLTAIIDSGMGGPWALAHDPVKDMFYCIDEDDNEIIRWQPGADIEWYYVDLLEGLREDSRPGGAALDPVGRRLYWTDTIDDTIRYVNIDAGSDERTIVELLKIEGDPGRIILVPEPHAMVLALAAALLLGRRRIA